VAADLTSAHPPRAVLDTSALYAPRERADFVRAMDAGLVVGVWSEWIVGELWRCLAWQWAEERGLAAADRRAMGKAANSMMRILASRLTLVSFIGPLEDPWPSLTDVDDEPVWRTALAAGAQYVVSKNTRDFPPSSSRGTEVVHVWDGVEYLTPGNFFSRIGWR
jgi:hypothetical protein